LQGCFVSDAEIHNLVNYWQSAKSTPTQATSDQRQAEEVQAKLPWADIMDKANKDDLLEEAVKLVVESGRVSTSLLQRRLGIGYPRASRLMDQLEEEGVIGPADGSKPRAVLWHKNRDEAEYEAFEKDVAGDVVREA
jgi:S-DNA-T family DNA segregation ATPase FtsK/SpoIIIE